MHRTWRITVTTGSKTSTFTMILDEVGDYDYALSVAGGVFGLDRVMSIEKG